MHKPALAWGLIIVGLAIIVLAGFADSLGLGQQPGFGWRQAVGMAVGIAAVVRGIFWRRRLSAKRST